MINLVDLNYEVVPEVYRDRVPRKNTRRNLQTDREREPLIADLLDGKTLLIDAQIPIEKSELPAELRTLYSFFNARGYKLRMHLYDDIDMDIYRGIILWAEPLVKIWSCSRCEDFEVSSIDTKPSNDNCKSSRSWHSWRQVKKLSKRRIEEQIKVEVIKNGKKIR